MVGKRPRKRRRKYVSARKVDSRYKPWRKAVVERDKHCCRFPGCCKKTGLEVHHIHRWADSVELRYNIDNGITLCKYHHKLVTRNEADYSSIFTQIVRGY